MNSSFETSAALSEGPAEAGASAPEIADETSKPVFKPAIGRIVHYTITKQDADAINRRRTTSSSILERLKAKIVSVVLREEDKRVEGSLWPAGAQAHIGNSASEGQVFPLMITRVWGDTEGAAFNGQLFLDGTDVLWVTSTHMSAEPKLAFCHVPPRV